MSRCWMMLLYSLPAQPSTQRVYVWRRLKSLGAVYLQTSSCVLPDSSALRKEVEQLVGEITARKGEHRLLTVAIDRSEEEKLIGSFRDQSDEEYREFLGQCRDFHAELAQERAKRHFSFAELEENQAELDKLQTWLPKIKARDFFNAKLKKEADQGISKCVQDFSKYSEEVIHAEGVHGSHPPLKTDEPVLKDQVRKVGRKSRRPGRKQ